MFFVYKSKSIVLYNNVSNPLFDILHVIRLLDLDIKQEQNKYNEFRDKITNYAFVKNKFDGYILKEFISEGTMYDIILSSNSDFSKSFKKDVSKLLCKLRKSGNLKIINDELTYKKEDVMDKDNELVLSGDIDKLSTMSYKNENDVIFVKKLIKLGKTIPLTKYMDKHVLYGCIAIIKDISGEKKVFIKIGYSFDFSDRKLSNEYGCRFYLIGIKVIQSHKTEDEFHNAVRQNKPYLIVPMKIDGKNKDEVYYFSEDIYNEFMNVEEYTRNDVLLIEQEKTKQIQEQEKTKQEQEKTKQIQAKIKLEQEKTEQLRIQLRLAELQNKT